MYKNKPWDELTIQEISQLQDDFLSWYEREKRNLPWRVNLDPYRIWISEIMLQQTRVDTVIDYYYRFMTEFPTIEKLAQAPEEKLLKVWEGLGYYSRARNLKIAAQQIMANFDGKMPQTIKELLSLKGIGPYTAGAIGSIAFHLPAPAVDGNVMRVVSRLFELTEDISKSSSRKVFEEAMNQIISPSRPGDFNQAMMDLGSSICTPTSPNCPNCPLQRYCSSYKQQTMEQFPVKSKKIKPKDVYYVAYIMENQQKELLIEQREGQGLLANMWLFPMQEMTKENYLLLQQRWLKNEKQLSLMEDEPFLVAEECSERVTPYTDIVWQKKALGEVTHIFSHLKWHILILYGRATKNQVINTRQQWVKETDFSTYVFPKPQQKIIELYKKEYN